MTDRKEEQAALHALHMLDGHERQILRAEMRSDANLRALVADLEDAAAHLLLLLPEEKPPGEARALLLQQVRDRRRPGVRSLVAPLRRLSQPWLAWLAAGILAILAWRGHHLARRATVEVAALRATETEARRDVTEARAAEAELARQLASAREQVGELAAEVSRYQADKPVGRMEAMPLRSSFRRYDDVVAVVIWDADRQEGRLRLERMPPPPVGREYQLWVVDRKTQDAVSAGVVRPEARGVTFLTFKPAKPVAGAAKFLLSIEEPGGAARKSADSAVVFSGP